MNIPIFAARSETQLSKPAHHLQARSGSQREFDEWLPRRLSKLIKQLWQRQKKISWNSVLLCASLMVAISGAAARETKATLLQPLLYIDHLFQVPSEFTPAGIKLPRLLPVIPRRDNVA